MDQLLIVTCYRDAQQFLIQCRSIGKNLAPCCVNIVVNEHYTDPWDVWFESAVAKYLVNHTVKVYKWTDFVEDYNELDTTEYNKQQIYKLLFATKTNNSYVVLDSKDWISKPISLRDLHKNSRTRNVVPAFRSFYQYCQDQWGSADVRGHVTPYTIDSIVARELLSQFTNVTELSKFFNSHTDDARLLPSEFIMYDVFAQSRGLEQDPGQPVRYSAILPSDSIDSDLAPAYWKSFCSNSNYKILTIRSVDFKRILPSQLPMFTSFLE